MKLIRYGQPGAERPGLVDAQGVDRNDARVLEPGGDERLALEPRPRRLGGEDELLERDRAAVAVVERRSR